MEKKMKHFERLLPVYKDYLWGGERLKELYGKETDAAPLAESWEFSAHKDGESILEHSGLTLKQYIKVHGQKVLGETEALVDETFLIKFIDAKKDLSIQVHPDDTYARRVENDNGKTEMWIVLDSEPNAYLYLGVKEDISKEAFVEAIQNHTLVEKLNKYYVKKGDVFFVPAGTIHAIGEGALICEIQQCSNVTYRLYDFGRKDANGNERELHIEKGVEVSHLKAREMSSQPERILLENEEVTVYLMRTCPYFTVKQFIVRKYVNVVLSSKTFYVMTFLEGEGLLTIGEQTQTVKKGESYFIPAQEGECIVEGSVTFVLSSLC